MRNLVEKQLSWLALLVTAFYSLLASCRSEECGHERLYRCVRPLERIDSSDLSIAMKKEKLQELCPDFEAGMKCIQLFTVECIPEKQRDLFASVYTGTNMAIMELCQDGPYQDEFLKHAACTQKVQQRHEVCYQKYHRTIQEIERENRTTGHNGSLKPLCCTLKQYLECAHHEYRRQCGEEAARFTKEFLNKMMSSLLKMYCTSYTDEDCAIGSGGSISRVQMLVPVLLVLLGRYFT